MWVKPRNLELTIVMAKVLNLGTQGHILSKWPCFPKMLMAGSSQLFSTCTNKIVLYFKDTNLANKHLNIAGWLSTMLFYFPISVTTCFLKFLCQLKPTTEKRGQALNVALMRKAASQQAA